MPAYPTDFLIMLDVMPSARAWLLFRARYVIASPLADDAADDVRALNETTAAGVVFG